jgi:hypothetical protein
LEQIAKALSLLSLVTPGLFPTGFNELLPALLISRLAFAKRQVFASGLVLGARPDLGYAGNLRGAAGKQEQ